MTPDDLSYGAGGLVPAVVQDWVTGRVLMLGYLDREAVAATIETRQVHFWSRSRQELWRKGATSGNTLEVVDMAADCDGDAVLITARPAGPTCHTGRVSCFGRPDEVRGQGFARLEPLWDTIRSRAAERPAGSYTAELIDGGVDAAARKLIEEAAEVVLSAKNHAAGDEPADRVAGEAADLVYHLLVLLAERAIEPAAVLGELGRRAGSAGPVSRS